MKADTTKSWYEIMVEKKRLETEGHTKTPYKPQLPEQQVTTASDPAVKPTIKYSHYKKDVSKYAIIDIYRVLRLYGVTDPSISHAVKKLLCPGGRGGKSTRQDVQEAIDSLKRYLEMEDEDGEIC